jgi:two-component system, NtrC family, sensor histidine kinase KinB
MQELADFPLLQIAVTDTGSRIPAQLREYVFDKFFRVEQHHENAQAGVKAPASAFIFARQLIEEHGGSISCQSGEKGLGPSRAMTTVNQYFKPGLT